MNHFSKLFCASLIIFAGPFQLMAQLFVLDENIRLKNNIHIIELEVEDYKNGVPNPKSERTKLVYEFDKQKHVIKFSGYRNSQLIVLINMSYDQQGNILKETAFEDRGDKIIYDTLIHNYKYEGDRKVLEYSSDSSQIISYDYSKTGKHSTIKYRFINKYPSDGIYFDRIFGCNSPRKFNYFFSDFFTYQNKIETHSYDSLNRPIKTDIFKTDSIFANYSFEQCSLYHYDFKNRMDGLKIISATDTNYIDYEFNKFNRVKYVTKSFMTFSERSNLRYREILEFKDYEYDLSGKVKAIYFSGYNIEGELEINHVCRVKYSYY